MIMRNITFFVICALCLIGCSSGSSGGTVVSDDPEGADLFVNFDGSQSLEVTIYEGENHSFTLNFGNYGPDIAEDVMWYESIYDGTDTDGMEEEEGTVEVEDFDYDWEVGGFEVGTYWYTVTVSSSTLDEDSSNNTAVIKINVIELDNLLAPLGAN